MNSKEIKTSQEFINAKFEQVSKTIKVLQCENEFLNQENSQLKANATEISNTHNIDLSPFE